MTVQLLRGDCREMVKTLADSSIDAIVCDPPYSLVSIQKRFGKLGSAPAKEGTDGLYRRASAGFMGQQWDTGEVAHDPEWWAECWRVLKPGAHLVAFGGTRTFHRMACAIEDGGFEVRDTLAWIYATGFPKSHNVAMSIDKAAGVERPAVSEEAKQWVGWGTALKPAWENIILARKPLIGTVAANVLQYGTGAINIDACRIVGESPSIARRESARRSGVTPGHPGEYGDTINDRTTPERYMARRDGEDLGRWPANILTDGSDEVVSLFPQSKRQQGDVKGTEPSAKTSGVYGEFAGRVPFNKRAGEASAERRYTDQGSTDFAALPGARRSDGGSAARFFFSAKGNKTDRWGTTHPTVKPIALMRWLCRLVTPPGGTILDPFAGSGTTGIAAMQEGFNAILIEREAQYAADIEARLAHFRSELDAATPLFAAAAQ